MANSRRKAMGFIPSMPARGVNSAESISQLRNSIKNAKDNVVQRQPTGLNEGKPESRPQARPQRGPKTNRNTKTKPRNEPTADTVNPYNVTNPSMTVEIINKSQGFAIFNENSACVSFDSRSDGSLYANPYKYQKPPLSNSDITAKTLVNIVSPTPFLNANSADQADIILADIYYELNREILANTNGGNKGAVDVFTLDNFKDYVRSYGELYAYFIELTSRMAWATTQSKANLVCRSWANYLGSDISIMNIRNDMAYCLADACSTTRIMDYTLWFWQTYMQNDHDYSMNHVHMSKEMFSALFDESNGIEFYTSQIQGKLDYIYTKAQEFSIITALLETKLDTPRFVNYRTSGTPSNSTCYDADFNDLFANVSCITSIDGTAVQYLPAHAGEGDPIFAAFSRDPENVPIHVTEYLCNKLGVYSTFYSPIRIGGGFPTTDFRLNNKFLAYQDPAKISGTWCDPRNSLPTQVGEDLITVQARGDGSGFDFIASPRGLRSYLYECSYNNLELAKRRFYLDVFMCRDRSQG